MRWQFTLTHGSDVLVLDDEPMGWSDAELKFERDKEWHGIFFNYSISLQFYGTGLQFLRDVYETEGVSAYVELLIELAASDTDGFEDFYRSKILMINLDFSCADDCTVAVTLEPAGCLMLFKNRSDQKVDLDSNLDFNNNALAPYTGLGVDVSLLPKTIVQRSISTIENDHAMPLNKEELTLYSGLGTQTSNMTFLFSVPIDTVSLNEAATLANITASYDTALATLPSQFQADLPINATIEWRYNFEITSRMENGANIEIDGCPGCGSSPYEAIFHDWLIQVQLDHNGTYIHTDTIVNLTNDCDCAGLKFVTFTSTGSVSVTLAATDTVRLSVRVYMGGTWKRPAFGDEILPFITEYYVIDDPLVPTYFNVRAETNYPATPCRIYLINEVFSRITEGITADCMRAYSDYFGRTDAEPYTSGSDGCGSLEALMKGLHIRQFPAAKVLMALSFKDVFEAMSAIHCIGIGVEPDTDRVGNYERIRIEPFAYWYDNTELFEADGVPEFRRRVKGDEYISIFATGYEKWEAENSMGLDEFNTKRDYRTTYTSTKNTLDRRCRYIASGYAIEVTRQKEYVDDSTKDWRWDNDTFVLCVRRDGGGAIVVEQGTDCADTGTMTDVIDPATIYNYRISPVRNLLRWGQYLFANYYPDHTAGNAKWIFNSGEGNFIAKGTLLNGCYFEAAEIGENETVDIASYGTATDGAPVLVFEELVFDYPVPWATVKAWLANPSLLRGYIKFRPNAATTWMKGYIRSASYKPNQGIVSFTLIPQFQ